MDENKQFDEQELEATERLDWGKNYRNAEPSQETVEIAGETEQAAEQTEEVLSPEAAFAEEMMADRRPAEDLPIEELPLSEKPERSAKESKKERTAKIVVLSVMGVLLLGLLAFAIVFAINNRAKQNAQEVPAEEVGEHSRVDMDEMMKYGPFAYTDEALAEKYNAKVAAKVGDHELTNGMLQIFYWGVVYDDLNQNADYLSYRGPDTPRPFAEQKYGEVVNWEQHYLQNALDYYLQNIALYEDAVKNGTVLSAERQEALDNLPANLAAQASEYGYASLDDYMVESYGPAVSIEEYVAFNRISGLAYTRALELQDEINMVKAALLSLTEREREVLTMKFFLEMTDEEIAQQWGLKPVSIRVILNRARKRLAQRLKREEGWE